MVRLSFLRYPPKPAPKPVPPPPPGLKRALLVGNNYDGTPYQLAGCVEDVKKMQAHIAQFFPTCKEVRVLTDASRASILGGIAWLVNGLRAGENVLFQFSGHGGRVRDINGDEVSGYDSCIYPVNKGELEYLVDDELRQLLAAKIPSGSKALVVLDCCHSGSAVDLRYTWKATSPTTLAYTENKQYAKTAGQVLFLSGCRDEETASEAVDPTGRPCGAMTLALLDTWKTYGSAIKVKYILWDMYVYLKQRGFTQIPLMSASTSIDVNTVFDLRSIS